MPNRSRKKGVSDVHAIRMEESTMNEKELEVETEELEESQLEDVNGGVAQHPLKLDKDGEVMCW